MQPIRIRTLMALGLLGLLGLAVTASAEVAKDPRSAEGLSTPSGREARTAHLFAIRDLLATMRPSPGRKLPTPVLEAVAEGGPRAPGTGEAVRTDLGRLAQFLRNAVQQSYHKPFQDAYNVLKDSTEAALRIGNLPPGIEALLRGGLHGGYKADKWNDAWGILHTVLKAIGESPDTYAYPSSDTFRRSLGLARRSSWERSFQNAFHAIDQQLRAQLARPELAPGPFHLAALQAALDAGASANEWDDAWRIQDRSMKVLEEVGGGDARKAYLNAALNGSYENSFENATKALQAFARRFVAVAPDAFDRLTLETAMRSADASNTWNAAYAILRDAFKSLAR